MAITVTPGTKTVYIPQSYLTLLTGLGVAATEVYELDLDTLRLDLKAWEDDELGSPEPATHRHNTEVTLAGTVYARVIEFINGWIIDFEDTGTPYIVSCTGANSNILDVVDLSGANVSVLPNNSAGLIVTSTSGLTTEESEALQFMADIEGGRWIIDEDAKQMIFYKPDNITEVARFNMLDSDGVATGSPPDAYERTRV